MLSNLSKDIIYVHGICRFIVKHNAIYKKRTKTDLLSGKLFFNFSLLQQRKKMEGCHQKIIPPLKKSDNSSQILGYGSYR